MKVLVSILMLCLLATCVAWGEDVEAPRLCQSCGMDRTAFSKSRMVIVYDDGTRDGVCSLHCAVEQMKKNTNKVVASLLVADYGTNELIDARGAVWVVGGNQAGGMNIPAKWAFSGQEGAQGFVNEHGGKILPYDEVMKTAALENEGDAGQPHGHMGHDMGHMGHDMHMDPGSQMTFNPGFGDDIYHTHPEGMWMVNYKFMHVGMNGLRDGVTDVPVSKVSPVGSSPYGYMMTPTSMSMDMQMLMVMYGLTDKLTLMGMANYTAMSMDMLMNMGMGNVPEAPMRTSGFGDTELRGIYAINKQFVGSLGVSIPTGDTSQVIEMMGRKFRAPYDMQLGSGTFDLKPALTYSALSDDALWNWGGQAMYTYHVDHNSDGYSLGDGIKLTTWLQRALGPASGWLRLAFSDTAHISGSDPHIAKILDGAPMPDADPKNYGGKRLDGLIGASLTKGPFSFGLEAGIPLYQNLNGLQLKTDWSLNLGIQAMF